MRVFQTLTATAATAFMSASAWASKPVDGGLGLQEPATPVMEEIVKFHNGYLMWVVVGISLLVLGLMIFIAVRFNEKANPTPSKTSHNTLLEVVWTILPVIILIIMVFPSMKLLYMQDDLPETEMTIKVVGNTWNWEYSYVDYENIDSFIANPLEKEDAEAAGKPYLLATDTQLVVPVDTPIKVLITSSNNLHSWTVPAFGIKMDAIPGRVNETWFQVFPGKEGTYYGQCSELCGVLHYKMPIEVEVVSKEKFAEWVANDGAFTSTVASNTGGGSTTAAQK